MGNKHSHSGERRRSSLKEDPAADGAFNELSHGKDELKQENFKESFGEKIGTVLWTKLAENETSMDKKTFSVGYREIGDIQTDQWVEMFGSIEEFLSACMSVVNADLSHEKPEYVEEIKSEAQKGGSCYFDTTFPGLLQYTILRKVRNVMYRSHESDQVIFETKSKIITPLQFVLLQSSLSESVYFKHKQQTKPCWSILYDSSRDGLSVNRFESHVFGYHSPTASIFRLNDGHVYAIANNTEWKCSTKLGGSTLTRCFQLQPSFKQIETRHSEPLFCNFKFRSSEMGIGFKDVFTVSCEFDNVVAIEVWGCGDEKSLESQAQEKLRHQQQAERNQKVPLPGNWDENPDKSILEMGGFKFSNERNYKAPPKDDE